MGRGCKPTGPVSRAAVKIQRSKDSTEIFHKDKKVSARLNAIDNTAPVNSVQGLVNMQRKVRVDYCCAVVYDKFVVIDGATVETGSFDRPTRFRDRAALHRRMGSALAVAGGDEPAVLTLRLWRRES
jgi:hypothetical protein